MASDEGFLTEEQRELLRRESQNNGHSSLSFKSQSSFNSDNHSRVKHSRRHHSGKLVRVKKDGAGGKGTWGRLLDTDGSAELDPNDPNYDSEEMRKSDGALSGLKHDLPTES